MSEEKESKKEKSFEELLQAKANAICKSLEVKPIGFDPPTGTNGAVSTGSLVIDLISGGGFPKHRMTTIAGDSGGGKSTIVGKSEGIQLAKGNICHHLDVEGSADYQWMLRGGTDMNLYLGTKGTAKKPGIPKKLWYIPDFNSGDDAFRYMIQILEASIELDAQKLDHLANVFYLDSIHACVSERLLDNLDKGDSPDLAILLSKFVPVVRTKLRKANSVFVATNQIRTNPRCLFGNPEYEPGGNTPTFYADLKLRLNHISKPKALNLKDPHKLSSSGEDGKIKAGGVHIEENPDGTIDKYVYTHVKTLKNRVAPPLKESYFRIWIEENGSTGRGIDIVWDTIRFFEEIGLCQVESVDEVILKGQIYSYYDLKKEILQKPDLYQEAQNLIESGKAFELYFNRLSGAGVEIGKPDSEEPDKGEIA